MSRGDETRRLMQAMQMLGEWTTQQQLSVALGVDPSTVYLWLRGFAQTVGVHRRQTGRVVEYMLMTPADRADNPPP
jgi:hypothetical protein